MFTQSLCCRIWWTRSFSAYVLPWSQICLLYSQLLWLLSRQTESSLKERPFSHCKRHYLPYFVERHYGGRTPTHHKERWPRRWRGTERSWPAQQTTKAELLPEASDQGFCMTSTIGPAWLYSTNRSGDQATYADSGRGSVVLHYSNYIQVLYPSNTQLLIVFFSINIDQRPLHLLLYLYFF